MFKSAIVNGVIAGVALTPFAAADVAAFHFHDARVAYSALEVGQEPDVPEPGAPEQLAQLTRATWVHSGTAVTSGDSYGHIQYRDWLVKW
jgi:hypothetical protein